MKTKFLSVLLIALVSTSLWRVTYAQTQNLNNGNLENVNAVWINDPGPEEGIKWLQTNANWTIDVSPENRTNADGNLNIYGTSNNIVLWRPLLLKSNLQVTGTGNHYISNGDFGIGTPTPEAKLHVLNTSYLGSALGSTLLLSRLEGRTGNYFNISTWLLRDADGSDWFTSRYHNGISVDGSYFTPGVNTRTWWERDPYNNIQSWGNSNATYFTINNGKIGIGITNPTEKLVVDGIIIAEEVKVQNVPASDYVFESDYNLRPIEEVETFIQKNKHLPDIPSAEEFKENGVGLGEMDNMLLRKVEELMLYVIELKKENEEQAKRLNSLEEENLKLKMVIE